MPAIRCSSLALLALTGVGCPGVHDSSTLEPDNSPRPEACDRYSTTGFFGVELHASVASFSGSLLSGPSPLTLASEAWTETNAGCVMFETASGRYFDVETEP